MREEAERYGGDKAPGPTDSPLVSFNRVFKILTSLKEVSTHPS